MSLHKVVCADIWILGEVVEALADEDKVARVCQFVEYEL